MVSLRKNQQPKSWFPTNSKKLLCSCLAWATQRNATRQSETQRIPLKMATKIKDASWCVWWSCRFVCVCVKRTSIKRNAFRHIKKSLCDEQQRLPPSTLFHPNELRLPGSCPFLDDPTTPLVTLSTATETQQQHIVCVERQLSSSSSSSFFVCISHPPRP